MSEPDMLNNWICKPSNVCGLRYIPTIEPEYSDDDQRMFTRLDKGFGLPLCQKSNQGRNEPLVHTGQSVRKSHIDLIKESISPDTMSILEIGVNLYKKPLISTTTMILEEKDNTCVYLGVDINDKSYLNDPNKNIHTMLIDSICRHEIRKRLLELEVLTVDLLLIDGDHSISMTVNDWCFVEFLSPFGIVILHDTNIHIGPRSVFDAIDEISFEKFKIGTGMTSGKFTDYGIGIARRLF